MIAPFVMNGPVNRRAFETYIERVLVPELRPNNIVIMDNLSKLKAHLRKAAGRTLETLWNTIGEISKMFPPIECANYFVPAGYNPDR